MTDDEVWLRLSPADRLELVVAFDLELRRAPRALIDAVWAGVDALKAKRDSGAPPQD
jgi:hypothetical protein